LEKNVGKGIVKVLQGDITTVKADAIVNAANSTGYMQAGVAGGLKGAGGRSIEDEARKRAPIPLGTAVETHAGDLRARYVIHAVAMGPEMRTDPHKIRMATRAALKKADGLRLETMAFPSIGVKVGGFQLDSVARIMVEEVVRYLRKAKSLKRVAFVLYDEKTFEAYRKEVEKQAF